MLTINLNYHFVVTEKTSNKIKPACSISFSADDAIITPFTKDGDHSSGITPNELVDLANGKFSTLLITRNTLAGLDTRVSAIINRLKTEIGTKMTNIDYVNLPSNTIEQSTDGQVWS